jgi:hypothetical protein
MPKISEILRLRNSRNLGYSVAVNRGFDAAKGDIIIQLNTDLILDSSSITAMIDLIEHESNVGIVGSKLIFPTTGLVQHIGMAFGNNTKPHVYFDLPSSHPLCKKTRECQITTGATVAMTRSVLEKVGLWTNVTLTTTRISTTASRPGVVASGTLPALNPLPTTGRANPGLRIADERTPGCPMGRKGYKRPSSIRFFLGMLRTF